MYPSCRRSISDCIAFRAALDHRRTDAGWTDTQNDWNGKERDRPPEEESGASVDWGHWCYICPCFPLLGLWCNTLVFCGLSSQLMRFENKLRIWRIIKEKLNIYSKLFLRNILVEERKLGRRWSRSIITLVFWTLHVRNNFEMEQTIKRYVLQGNQFLYFNTSCLIQLFVLHQMFSVDQEPSYSVWWKRPFSHGCCLEYGSHKYTKE